MPISTADRHQNRHLFFQHRIGREAGERIGFALRDLRAHRDDALRRRHDDAAAHEFFTGAGTRAGKLHNDQSRTLGASRSTAQFELYGLIRRRVSLSGHRAMAAALKLRQVAYPSLYAQAA